MLIKNIGFSAWRYSLRALNEFPFYRCSNMKEVRELTRKDLEKKSIARWSDKLLYRPDGYHHALLTKSNTSNVIRQLNYASEILMSSVIKNDIGLRGGISPIFHEIRTNRNDTVASPKKPLRVNFINTDSEDFSPQSLIDFRKSRDDYIIPYSIDTQRVYINDSLSEQINIISNEIAYDIITDGCFQTDCAILAIDFFIHGNVATPFECHFPGRGLGLHLIPFLFSSITCSRAQAVINNIKHQLAQFYGTPICLNIRNSGNTTFHELDRILISLISETNTSMVKSIDLDVNGDIVDFRKRDCEINNYIPQIIVSDTINEDDLPKIKRHLGEWIILKTRMNTPWWSSLRKKSEILLTDDKFIQRVNYIIRMHGEIILQRLVTDSIDTYGHFGELRIHFLIAR